MKESSQWTGHLLIGWVWVTHPCRQFGDQWSSCLIFTDQTVQYNDLPWYGNLKCGQEARERGEEPVGDQAVGPLGLVGQQVLMEHLRQDKRRVEPNLLPSSLPRSVTHSLRQGLSHVALEKSPIAILWTRFLGTPLPAYPQLAGPMLELLALWSLSLRISHCKDPFWCPIVHVLFLISRSFLQEVPKLYKTQDSQKSGPVPRPGRTSTQSGSFPAPFHLHQDADTPVCFSLRNRPPTWP